MKKKEKKMQEKKKRPNLATSCQFVSDGNTDSCLLYSENFFFLEMIVSEMLLVPMLPCSSVGDCVYLMLVLGDRFDTARHTEEGTWNGFDPQVSVQTSTNTKDQSLWKRSFFL